MDIARAIEINQTALSRIVAAIFAMVGLVAGGTVEQLPGAIRRAALRLLRPAESAVRRLIIIAAHGLVVESAAPRAVPAGLKGLARGPRAATFQLFDPRKVFNVSGRRRRGPAGPPPRITIFCYDPRVPLFRAAPLPPTSEKPADDDVSERSLCRRLAAISSALADLPKQARRLARWRVRRARMPVAKFRDPLRPGTPPGHRKQPGHEIDRILQECHALARDLSQANTS